MNRSAVILVVACLVAFMMKVQAARYSADRALTRPAVEATQADGDWAVWAAAAAPQ